MTWPIRNQILLPFATLLIVSVSATTVVSVWLASRRIERETVAELNRVIATLAPPDRSWFPLSRNVLETMRGLSGADFVVLDEAGRQRATSLEGAIDPAELAALPARGDHIETLAGTPTVTVAEIVYHAVPLVVPRAGGGRSTLVVLYPQLALDRAQRDAILPSLLSGVLLLAGTVLLAAVLANRTTKRLGQVGRRVARIVDGDFEPIELDGPNDEVRELSQSVNRMAERLRELQTTMLRTERVRVLGQLAGGLAHQLRNAATGARLAVQLHLKRHADADNEGLSIALQQLELVEEQIKSLLSLGKEEQAVSVSRTIGEITEEVMQLVASTCEHEHVTFDVDVASVSATRTVTDAEGIRSALLNLVLNAIEAAGPNGHVGLATTEYDGVVRFTIYDNGPGPSPEVAEALFEPFVTGKPEGVGLGLALVARVAERSGGGVRWERRDETTFFLLDVPAAVPTSEPVASLIESEV